MHRLMLVDDDERMTELLSTYLRGHGYAVDVACDGLEALRRAGSEHFDLIILDIMLPVVDGIECLRQLRRASNVPILMLTARGDDTDRIVGLEMGADDYVSKPFNPRELVARIKGILRRSVQPTSQSGVSEGALKFPTFVLDTHRRALEVRGRPVPLTSLEFELLLCLVRHAGRAMSREQLLDQGRGQDYAVTDRTIDVHISHLRQKIEDDPRNPRYIKTVWGFGYMFVREC